MIACAIVLAAAGYITITAFGSGKTLEQQNQEIAAAVTARLDELRAQKEEECTARVNEDAQRRYQEFLASQPAEPVKSGTRSTRRSTTTPKVTPLPQKAPTDPQKQRPGAAQPADAESQKQRPGATSSPATSGETAKPVDAQQQKKRPGAAGGGGN